MSPEADETCK